MTVVHGTLLTVPTPSRSTEVTATLVDTAGQPAVGYVASVEGEIVQRSTTRASTEGAWSFDLTPNALVDSPQGDTLWAITEGRGLGGAPIVTHVLVPEDPGPWWVGNVRVVLPGEPSGDGGTVIYVPGPAGASYRHTQTVPAATWQIPHQLGYRPTISLAYEDGRAIYGDVLHASPTLAVVTFPTPIAGTATCS
ncbi:hypothetical protein [Streptomyces sp. NPDC060243]|uniref:hypothetical protein n=1 Tax=Streptomyces sp. NPDC060243 TaxID=3347081 RepID=UPI003646C02B